MYIGYLLSISKNIVYNDHMSKKKEHKTGLIKLIIFIYKTYYPKGKYRRDFLTYVVFNFLYTTYPLILSFISAYVLDEVIKIIESHQDIQNVIPLVIYFGITLLFKVVISNGYEHYDQIVTLWRTQIEDNVFLPKHISTEPQAFEDSEYIKERNTLDWNAWSVYNSMLKGFETLGRVLTAIIAFIAIVRYNYIFALIAIFAALPGGIITTKFGRTIWNIWGENSEEKIKYSSYRWPLWEARFEQKQEIFIFRYGQYLLDQAQKINLIFTKKLEKSNTKKRLWLIFASVWKNVFYLLIFAYSIKLAIDGDITIGAFTFILAAYQEFNWKAEQIIHDIAYIIGNRNILEIFHSLLTRENKIQSGDIVFPENPNGVSIEFKNVSFKYPKTDKWIFKNLSFKINTDEDLAVVGQNGAGKTTLIKLLLRIYDINEGEILINSVNVKDLDLDSYYDSVAVLNQSFNQLGITAEDNIHIGNIKNKDKKKVKDAAKLADTHETIRALPKGYKTYLTKDINDGTQLSGGQWQKVAIARAFYRDAKLLILDEPTSAVDAISEEKIFDNIRRNATNKTTLIISHRFSTVKKANKIIVIDKGKIVEEGNHESLMKNKGLYSEMYLKQSI